MHHCFGFMDVNIITVLHCEFAEYFFVFKWMDKDRGRDKQQEDYIPSYTEQRYPFDGFVHSYKQDIIFSQSI